MGDVLRLVAAKPSQDTIDALQHALDEARAGRAIGAVILLMHSTTAYTIDIAGELRRHPTYGRGMVRALDDHLADLTGR